MTGGHQVQQEPRVGEIGAERRRLYAQNSSNQEKRSQETNYEDDDQFCNYKLKREPNDTIDGDDEDELLSEALLAVASAEEYAAKIIKLQQACLTPLKEDLADWLNKIMNMSSITTDNFMDKLDNGVIICRLAKIISLWCEQQLATATSNNDLQHRNSPQQAPNITNSHLKLDLTSTNHLYSQSNSSTKLSSSISNVHSPINSHDTTPNVENYEPFHQNCNRKNLTSVLATPLRQPQSRLTTFTNGPNGLFERSSSQSKNCLISSSTISLNNGCSTGNQFTSNLIRMEQTKIWEDAKCRTFYARDNVCNFIKWSKEFGVNQSVLFESDDLVLHANTRQVVLCLLDVARIACVKYGFTEAPGLVKFEQEIDRELAAEKAAAIELQLAQSSKDGYDDENPSSGDKQQQTNETTANRKLSSLARNSRVGSLADATDDLIMRYCLHKEEEAAKKKAAAAAAAAAAELEAKLTAEDEVRLAAEEAAIATAAAALEAEAAELAAEEAASVDGTIGHQDQVDSSAGGILTDDSNINPSVEESQSTTIPFEVDSLTSVQDAQKAKQDPLDKLPTSPESMMQNNNLNYDNRVDSLDSGKGRTESASTSHGRTPVNAGKTLKASCIPMPIKRSTSNSSLISNQTSSIGTSELSSSRSSLLSGQDSSSAKRHVASDLDGKVMRIAKSYYGKAATKGVTRLSEGKYKIADRIVFVRLLKGHLVMVRIGGGWDTLENFLFRHKSDPSQVIDVDNLLPLETKMTFEKSPQLTPTTSNKFSKLPYYRRSSSASSTNLSTSNLSVSNHSPTSGSTSSTSTSNNNATISNPMDQDSLRSSNRQSNNKQIPCLLIHRGQNPTKLTAPQTAFYSPHNDNTPQLGKGPRSQLSRTPNLNRYTTNRPLGSSRTPTASATNLYPATLTTRLASTGIKSGIGTSKVNSTTNLHNGRIPKQQEAFRKLGQSNDSLQASYLKAPQHQLHLAMNGNHLGARRKIETHRRSTNGLVRQSNSVNA